MGNKAHLAIAGVMRKMILLSRGNRHDINHFLKVHAFARLIAESEGLPPAERETLEMAALLHDIACPLCREKYGRADGKSQEREGMPLAERFFEGTDVDEATRRRVVYLVGHHHTLDAIDGLDYQILVEADYLVNADEANLPESNIIHARDKIFKTKCGQELLASIYLGGSEAKEVALDAR